MRSNFIIADVNNGIIYLRLSSGSDILYEFKSNIDNLKISPIICITSFKCILRDIWKYFFLSNGISSLVLTISSDVIRNNVAPNKQSCFNKSMIFLKKSGFSSG